VFDLNLALVIRCGNVEQGATVLRGLVSKKTLLKVRVLPIAVKGDWAYKAS
jgi:hypothetical protein